MKKENKAEKKTGYPKKVKIMCLILALLTVVSTASVLIYIIFG